MIIPFYYMFFFYMVRILLFLNFSRPFLFWILTELNLLFFIGLMFTLIRFEYKQEIHDLILFYFIIQSLSSIFFLRDFFFSLDFFIFNSDLIFILSMMIKLGVFPFFYWVFKVSRFVNVLIFVLILRIQKIPFYLVIFSSFNEKILFFLLGSFISGSLIIFYSSRIFNLLVCSSVSYRFWIFYLYNYRLFFFLFFFFIYRLVIFFFLRLYSINFRYQKNFVFLLILVSFFFGLAPLRLFFFKFFIIYLLDSNFFLYEIIFFWFFSFLSLFGYIKFFYKVFFSFNNFYLFRDSSFLKIFFFFLIVIFFFFFII